MESIRFYNERDATITIKRSTVFVLKGHAHPIIKPPSGPLRRRETRDICCGVGQNEAQCFGSGCFNYQLCHNHLTVWAGKPSPD